MSEEFESIVCSHPASRDVAIRAYLLQGVINYGFAALSIAVKKGAGVSPVFIRMFQSDQRLNLEDQPLEDIRSAIIKPIMENGLTRYLTKKEIHFLNSPPETLKGHEIEFMLYHCEALGILLWALHLISDIPPYYERFNRPKINLGKVKNPLNFISTLRRRNIYLLIKEHHISEMWFWRSKLFRMSCENDTDGIQRFLEVSGLNSLDNAVRKVSIELHKNGVLDDIIDEDFAVWNKPYRCLSLEEWLEVDIITSTRFFALSWLCGYIPENKWDN